MRNASGKTVAKAHLPTKTCAGCGRTFVWRKMWERSWGDMTCCSQRCRAVHRAARRAEEAERAERGEKGAGERVGERAVSVDVEGSAGGSTSNSAARKGETRDERRARKARARRRRRGGEGGAEEEAEAEAEVGVEEGARRRREKKKRACALCGATGVPLVRYEVEFGGDKAYCCEGACGPAGGERDDGVGGARASWGSLSLLVLRAQREIRRIGSKGGGLAEEAGGGGREGEDAVR